MKGDVQGDTGQGDPTDDVQGSTEQATNDGPVEPRQGDQQVMFRVIDIEQCYSSH